MDASIRLLYTLIQEQQQLTQLALEMQRKLIDLMIGRYA